MPSPWVWAPESHVYRNTATGRYIGTKDMLALRDTYASAKRQMAGDLARRVGAGEINIAQWEKAMRNDVRNSFIDQYVLAHGGRNSMTPADWGRIGSMTKDQYGYLHKMAEEIKAGTLTEKQIAARGGMYHDASISAYERAHALAYGMPDLPVYPASGASACLSNCRCAWDIQPRQGGWDCYWRVDPAAEHCDDCMTYADTYNPLKVEV